MVSQLKLTNNPNQTFKTTIPGDTHNLNLIITLTYNTMAAYWMMGLYDANTNQPIVLGVPLLCGHDLFEQLQYLNIGSVYVINIGDPTIEVPDDKTIGGNFILVWMLM